MRSLELGLVAMLTVSVGAAVGPTMSSAAACTAAVARDLPYSVVDGVEPALLSLDVSPVPGDCSAPVVVWIHGGGWQIGDKTNDAAARAEFYNGQGWVLVSVNYRLVVSGLVPPVGYPDFNEDVAAALAWVGDNIDRYGGDAERVLLVGHSAGAGIAAAVIADPDYLDVHGLAPDWIDCAVLLDTEGYDVAAMAERDGEPGVIYRAAFGDTPLVWADASPLSHVGEGPLPAHAVVVTRGVPRRTAAATAFGDRMRRAGSDVTVADVSPLTHADVNQLIGSGDPTMTPLLAATLTRCSETQAP